MRVLAAIALVMVVACSGCAAGITGVPGSITDRTAGVGGSVVSDADGQVEYWAEYGTTTAYGSQTTHETVTVTKSTQTAVGAFLSGLERGTTYHYRICARDSSQRGGPGCGQDRRLTTQSFACGETVTADVKLTSDVFCMTAVNPGIVIGADGIDVNLAGHTMFGLAPGSGGIDNTGGFDDLTVRNGSVSQIEVAGASRNHLTHMDGTVHLTGGEGNEIRQGGVVVDARDTAGLVVADLTSNAILVTGDGARIVRNDVTSGTCSRTLCSPYGISVDGDGNRVVDNEVRDAFGANVVVAGGAGNVVSGNLMVDGTARIDGPGDGLLVGSGAVDTVLRGNDSDSNEDDGFDVRSPSTRMRENDAVGNGDWGIDATPGVTDIGGNRASNNGQAAQCRGVFCTPFF